MSRIAVVFAVALAVGANGARAADGGEELVTASRVAKSPVTLLSGASVTSVTAATDSVQTLTVKDANAAPAYDAVAARGPKPDLSLIHGSASVSIGTGGYRSVSATAVMPVGNDGILGIAVRQTDYGKNGAFFDDNYGGYGYGYGAYNYGGYGHGPGYGLNHGLARRGGKQTSVAVALDMGDGETSSTSPAGCAPGFRDGDGRYVEPVWVTRLHDKRTCDASGTDASR